MVSRIAAVLAATLLSAFVFGSSADAAMAGGAIAFDRNGEIFVVNPDGTGQTQLTHTGGTANSPKWSPDGTQIAFQRSDGHFYVMNADGSGAMDVTASPPVWV